MRKQIISVLLLTFMGLAAQAQTKVKLYGVASPNVKFVYVASLTDRENKGDSVPVTDGKWKFEKEFPSDVLTLGVISDDFSEMKNHQNAMFAMADTVPTEIDLINHTVKGSKGTETFNTTMKGVLECMNKPITATYDSRDDAAKLMYSAVMDNLDSMVPVVFVPMLSQGLSSGALHKIFYTGAPYENHPLMAPVKEHMKSLDAKKNFALGDKFTDLTLNDVDGKSHSLSEWCGKGRYVLIDFWASWCAPCRAEMPTVVECYKKYHDKGLDIIGISFDVDKDAWKNAIDQMGLSWIHLSDLASWKSVAATTYGIKGIPSCILLDKNGYIIDFDMRGNVLDLRLKEIFGENK